MKDRWKYVLGFLLIFLTLFAIVHKASAQVLGSGTPWIRIGDSVRLTPALLTVGANGVPIEAGYFRNLNITGICTGCTTGISLFATSSADFWLTTKSTSDLAEGSNLYYTLNRFASALAGTTTNALPEGSANLYFTTARVANVINGSSTIPHKGGSAFGDILFWTGSKWDVTSTSSLGISGAVTSIFGRTGAVIAQSGDYTTTQVTEGTNLYYSVLRWASAFAGTTTDALAQGTTNKYYSTLLLAHDLAGTSTSALAEGSNLYYTDARVGLYISGSSTVPHVKGSAYGDLLFWTGSAWNTISTSSLGLSTNISAIYPLFYNSGTGVISSATSSASSAGVLSAADWSLFNGKQAAGNYITALTGDVTASGPGSATASLALNASHFWQALQNFTNASTSQLTATSSIVASYLTANQIVTTDANDKLVSSSSIGNNQLQNSSIVVATAAPLGGAATVPLGGTLNLTCAGCLTSAVTSVGVTYPLKTTGGNTPTLSVDYGTTTTNNWSLLQNFNGNASTTMFTDTGAMYLTTLATPAGTYLATGPTGQIIATTTPNSTTASGTSAPVQFASTSTLPANNYVSGVITAVGNGALFIDGNNPTVGQRLLIKNEAAAANNGIYTVTATGGSLAAFVLTRATDYNSSSNVYPGIATYVIGGATLNDDWWAMTSAAPISIGSTALNYTESSAGTVGTVTSIATNNGITGGTITTSGTIGLANVNANSVLGNITGSATTPTSVATSSLFNTAASGITGLLSGTDWTTFNGKVSTSRAINTTYPLQGGGDLSADRTINLAFGTTTSNFWNSLQVFNGKASSTLFSAYGPAYFGATATSSFSTTGALTLATPLTVANGGTGWASINAGTLLYGNAGNALSTTTAGTEGFQLVYQNAKPSWIATTTYNAPLSWVAGAVSCSTCLTANQSISLTGDVTGTGATSIATALVPGNNHWWTALQNFTNASTSQLTATSSVYFTSLATPAGAVLAVDNNGKVIATTTAQGTVTSIGTNNGITGGTITTSGTIGLANVNANSVLGNITGSATTPTSVATSSLFNIAASGVTGLLSGTDWNTFNGKLGAFGYTAWGGSVQTFYGTSTIASTTVPHFTQGLQASSTSYITNATTSLSTILQNEWFPALTAGKLLALDGNNTVVSSSTIGNNQLQNNSIVVTTAGPLGGAATVPLGGTLALTCATCNTTNATVSSIATNNGITGGTITTTGTLSLDQTFGAIWTAASSTYTNHLSLNTASTSIFTSPSIYTGLGTAAGSFLAVDPNGKIISTTTPGGVSSSRQILTTFPLQGGGDLSADRTLSLAFGTTTTNLWSNLQTFNGGASSTVFSAYGRSFFGSTATTTIENTGSIFVPGTAQVGIGTTTPQAALSIASSTMKTTGFNIPLFQISNASDTIFSVYSTSTNLASYVIPSIRTAVRAVIGSFVTSVYSLFVNGPSASSWKNVACDGFAIPSSLTTDSPQVCNGVGFDVVVGGSLSQSSLPAFSGLPEGALLAAGLASTENEVSLFTPGFHSLDLGEATPILDVVVGSLTNMSASTTKVDIGIDDKGPGVSGDIDVGCFVEASSTQSSWQAVCVNDAGAIGQVSTGVSTSSSPVRFQMVYEIGKFQVLAKTSTSSPMGVVATVTTGTNSTSVGNSMYANVRVKRGTNGTQINPSINVYIFHYNQQEVWEAN